MYNAEAHKAYYSGPQFGNGSLRFPTTTYAQIESSQRSKPKKKENSDNEGDSLVRRKRAKPKKKKEESDSDGESDPKKKKMEDSDSDGESDPNKSKDSSSEEADSDDDIDMLPTFVGRLLRDEDMRNGLKRKRTTDGFERNIKLFLKELADEIKELKQIVSSWESDEKLERLLAKVNKYKEDGFSSILAYQEAVKRLRPMIEELIKDELSKDNDYDDDDEDDDEEEAIQDDQEK